jgi:hypothetical protein
MSIQITVTEEEILSTPNYYDMGKKIHDRFWQARRDQEGPQLGDEHFHVSTDENGLVTSINKPWTCSICKGDTSEIDYDKCVLCGKESPYTISTHIDLREGYVEGGGQGCFQPNQCNK